MRVADGGCTVSSDLYAPIKLRKRVTLDDLMGRAALYVTGCGGTRRAAAGGDEHVIVDLRGSVSDPWRVDHIAQPTRWFELRIVTLVTGGRALMVTTRCADPFTRDVADGFARRCALEWGTEVVR